MPWISRALLLGIIITGFAAASAAAQQSPTVTQADIQRLQDSVYLADRDISQSRSRDAARASQLQAELDDLRDEVVYLKVKLRKERTLARSEYADVRDRIEDLRSRARRSGEPRSSGVVIVITTAPAAPRPAPALPSAPPASTRPAWPPGMVEVPVGTEIDVRLQNSLNSGTNQVEDRIEATTLVDVSVNSRVVIPAGSVMRGWVTAVEPATRTNRTGRMTVSFDQVTVNGQAYPIRGTVTEAIEGEGIKGEAARIGTGAGVGAIIGGILGGVKGALAGVLIGGGGTIAATEGKEVQIPVGSVLRVRLDSPAEIAAR